jgi:hypothetical protein
MPKITNINKLDFTNQELEYLETEMRKYKVPWLYKIVFGSLYKWGKYFMPLFFLVILIMVLIHNFSELDLWTPTKILSFIFIFGIGGLVFISWAWHRLKVLKECKRLSLTLNEWNILAIAFQITYI